MSNRYLFSKESIQLVCETVVKLCTGVQITRSVIITRFRNVERVQVGSNSKRIIRSMLCDRFVTMNSITEVCRKCQIITLNVPESNKENVNFQTDSVKDDAKTKRSTSDNSKKTLTIEDLKEPDSRHY